MSVYADDATVIGRQQRATVVLLSLLAHDLPPAEWTIQAVVVTSLPPMVEGLIRPAGLADPALDIRLAGLIAWAGHLGVQPTWMTYKNGGGKLQATAVITGVQVTGWTPLPSCPAEYRDPGPDPDAGESAAAVMA